MANEKCQITNRKRSGRYRSRFWHDATGSSDCIRTRSPCNAFWVWLVRQPRAGEFPDSFPADCPSKRDERNESLGLWNRPAFLSGNALSSRRACFGPLRPAFLWNHSWPFHRHAHLWGDKCICLILDADARCGEFRISILVKRRAPSASPSDHTSSMQIMKISMAGNFPQSSLNWQSSSSSNTF